jgi:hypothetical protein
MWRRDETAHAQASRFSRHEPERVQKEIRVHDADSLVCKVIDKSSKQSAKKRGLPEKLKKAIEARRQSKAKAAAKSSVSAVETGKKVKR